MNKYHRLFKIAYTLTAVLLITLLLVSCDGGGGGGNSDKIDSGNNGNGADGNDNSSIYPISMAAAGDSITVAYNADATASLFTGQTYEQYEVSWALADSARVNSHAQRLLALNLAFSWDAENDNYAFSGAKISDLYDQVYDIVQNGPYEYVTIFIGHNDICDASTPAEMVSTGTFETLFVAAMEKLFDQDEDNILDDNPPDVVVSSLARVANLYDAGKNDSWCRLIWNAGGICRIVTSGNSGYITQADQRTQEYNDILAYYATVYGYTYVPQIYDTQFTIDDLSDFDCFHPNISGQNKTADIIWDNGLY